MKQKIKIFTILILLIILFVISYFFYKKCISFYNAKIVNFIEKSKELDKRITKNSLENIDLANKNDELKLKIEILNNKISEYNLKLESLNDQINHIKSLTPEEQKLRFNLINGLNKILILANNEENFSNEIQNLITLSQGNDILLQYLVELETFESKKSINQILAVFDKESENLFVKNEKISSNFLNNFIKITKIQNKQETTIIANKIKQIKEEIIRGKFDKALNLINEFGFAKSLTNTINNLETEIKFNNLIKKIVNIL